MQVSNKWRVKSSWFQFVCVIQWCGKKVSKDCRRLQHLHSHPKSDILPSGPKHVIRNCVSWNFQIKICDSKQDGYRLRFKKTFSCLKKQEKKPCFRRGIMDRYILYQKIKILDNLNILDKLSSRYFRHAFLSSVGGSIACYFVLFFFSK